MRQSQPRPAPNAAAGSSMSAEGRQYVRIRQPPGYRNFATDHRTATYVHTVARMLIARRNRPSGSLPDRLARYAFSPVAVVTVLKPRATALTPRQAIVFLFTMPDHMGKTAVLGHMPVKHRPSYVFIQQSVHKPSISNGSKQHRNKCASRTLSRFKQTAATFRTCVSAPPVPVSWYGSAPSRSHYRSGPRPNPCARARPS